MAAISTFHSTVLIQMADTGNPFQKGSRTLFSECHTLPIPCEHRFPKAETANACNMWQAK